MRRSLVIAALAFAALCAAFTLGGTAGSQTGGDANESADAPTPEPLGEAASGETIPIVARLTLPAPPGSADLNYTFENLSASSAQGPQQLKILILDCFPGYNARSLTVDSVGTPTPPPGGTATVVVGNDGNDVGPAVIRFTNFGTGESMAFQPDLDNYIDANSPVNRANTRGCRAEAIFVGTLRGAGTAVLDNMNRVVINLTQTRPLPS